jgi:GT2 family glycosyltransferase/ADP-ribose pyrophosphatase YjhB (NUDIX family)
MTQPVISVVLGSYNRRRFLESAVKTIRDNGITLPYEIIVIDGGSTDGSIEYLTHQKDVISIVQHNKGSWKSKKVDKKTWGYYMNIAFNASHGKYVVMISDDSLLIPGAVMNAYELFEKELNEGEKIGGVAFYWRNYPDEKHYYVRQTLGHKLSINHGMYLKDALLTVGCCNEEDFPFYYGDGDLSLRLWNAGYKILDSKKSFVEHFHYAGMSVRQQNSLNKEEVKKIFLHKWSGTFYDSKIDNQSGKIYLAYADQTDTARLFRRNPRYYIGLLQSRFGWLYGYEPKNADRLPSLEMLNNHTNIQKILQEKNIKNNQLCFFAFIRNENKILMGLREYRKGSPVWTYPGGRSDVGEVAIDTLKREVKEEIGISNLTAMRVVGQKTGVKTSDQVYFIECEISGVPKLMEPNKFKEWKWFDIMELPNNLIDERDREIIQRLYT